MNPVSLALVIKGLGTLGLIIGGLMALRYGFHLYKDGIGTGKDQYALEVSGLKLKANSIGSVVMATAFAWAWAAVAMSPSLSQNGQNVQVYSFETPNGEVSSKVLAAHASADAASDPEELKHLFRKAVAGVEKSSEQSVVSVKGQPASLNLKTLEASSSSAGGFEISAHAATSSQSALLVYKPQVSKGRVVFIPAKAQAGPKQ
jgi:hypothetical protein